jgi:predicted RNA binding protein YcfA (HicA-like mRNA interferase family)
MKRRVVVPLHKKDLPKGTLLEILKQASINKEELRGLL